jgi:hypothetical protein
MELILHNCEKKQAETGFRLPQVKEGVGLPEAGRGPSLNSFLLTH